MLVHLEKRSYISYFILLHCGTELSGVKFCEFQIFKGHFCFIVHFLNQKGGALFIKYQNLHAYTTYLFKAI